MADYPIRKTVPDYDVAEIRQRYLKLSTGQVCDSLSEKDLKGQAMAPGVYPLVTSMKLAGPAFTVEAMTTPNMDKVDVRLGMVSSLFEGCVQIRNSGGNLNAGHFGEVNATAARAAGCVGAILDGSTRDSNMLIEMGFPTFCRFRSPVESFGRFMVIDYQVPIQVQGVDGLLQINPGDYLVGDNDGVVVVPAAMTLAVLEIAEGRAERERRGREVIGKGVDPIETQKKWGRF